MKKLWVVYNPRSSRHKAVEAEVLDKARKIKGMMLGKYEIKATSVEENAKALEKLLMDGDFVVAAGGDGTATIAANAVLRSKKKVVFTALGYGNFNDMARMLGGRANVGELVEKYKEGITEKAYPIEILIDGESWRYAMCYATFGLFAESTEVFDDEKVRKKLRSGKKSRVFSWWVLAKWYFKNRKKRDFIPECSLNGVKMPADTTDYVAMNSTRMAGVMKGSGWMFTKEAFGRATGRLRSFPKLVGLMSKSILSEVPTVEAKDDVIEMTKPGEIEVQVEGEYRRLKGGFADRDSKSEDGDRGGAGVMEEMYWKLQGMFASDLRDGWRVELGVYPGIVEKALGEITKGATRERRMIRVAGQSGSGKTTRLLPAARRKFLGMDSGAEPTIVSAERMLEYYPYREEVVAEYGVENLRRKTDDFTSMMMFLVLPELLKGGYDIILEVAFLGRELEAILVEWLKKAEYSLVIMVAEVSPEVSQSRLEKRGWRHEGKVERMFIEAMEESLEFYREAWPGIGVEFL